MKQGREEGTNHASQASKKRKRPLIESIPSTDSGYNCKFARALGSVDWHTREQGLQALTIWLTRNTVSDEDITKIWKALFFCFWHSDKAPVQNELAERLAAILPKLSEQGALQYFKIFARTIQREWFGIDKLRLDKFMVLARKFLHQVYTHLQNTGWDLAATVAYSSFLLEEVLSPSDADPSAGFSLHIADIVVQELISACEDAPVPAPALQALLEPCCVSLARTKRAALLSRLQDGIFEPLLEGHGSGALAKLDTQELATCLFNLGAQEGVKAKNRQICYSLSKALEKAGAKRRKREPQNDVAQPVQQSGVAKKGQAESRSAAADSSLANGVSQAASEAQASKTALKKLKSAAKARKMSKLAPGPSPDSQSAEGAEQPGSAKQGKKRQHRHTPQQPKHARGLSNGLGRQAPADEVALSASEKPRREPGSSSISQKDAARLVNAALNGTPLPGSAFASPLSVKGNGATGGGPGSKESKLRHSLPAKEPPAEGGSDSKKSKQRLSLPAMGLAAGAAEGKTVSVKKHMTVGSPKVATLLSAQSKAAAAVGDGLTDSQRKRVKFALKRNLYFAKGGPVPPADVRTPPTAQPKGSALKKSSGPTQTPRSPKSIPRARRRCFFEV